MNNESNSYKNRWLGLLDSYERDISVENTTFCLRTLAACDCIYLINCALWKQE